MGLTDLIEFAIELIPRAVRQVLIVLLAVGLILGPARPMFEKGVTWFIQTKAQEISKDITPIVQRMLIPTPQATTP